MLADRVRVGSGKREIEEGFTNWKVIQGQSYIVDLIKTTDIFEISFGTRTHREIIFESTPFDLSYSSLLSFDNMSVYELNEWSSFKRAPLEIPVEYRKKGVPLYFHFETVQGPEGYLGYVYISFDNDNKHVIKNINNYNSIFRIVKEEGQSIMRNLI